MKQEYLIKKLKTGGKLAQLEWEEGYALGCVEENEDVWVWKLNKDFELVRNQESGNHQVWDATADDLDTDTWLTAVNLKMEHILKLGFKHDKITDLYKFKTKFIKIEPLENHFNIYFKYTGNYVWEKKHKIKFLHEFIENCRLNSIKLPIDIKTECLEEFDKSL